MSESEIKYAPWEIGVKEGETISDSRSVPVNKPLGGDFLNPYLPAKSRPDTYSALKIKVNE